MDMPVAQQTAKHMAGGEMICKMTFSTTLLTVRERGAEEAEVLLSEGKARGPTIESGDERRPMKKDKEKLIVANVARNMPSKSREKLLKRRRC